VLLVRQLSGPVNGSENFGGLRGGDFAGLRIGERLIGRFGRLSPARLGLLEPVAFSVQVQNADVVGQSGEERAGEALIAECASPLVERQIGRHDRRAAFVALAEDFERQFNPGLRERNVAEFVDDQRFTPASWVWSLSRRLSSRASMSWLTSAAAVAKRTENPRWQAARPSARATWVLPVPLLPTAMMLSRATTYSQRANSSVSGLLSEGMAVKCKHPAQAAFSSAALM